MWLDDGLVGIEDNDAIEQVDQEDRDQQRQ
jgi:hypothetical protein